MEFPRTYAWIKGVLYAALVFVLVTGGILVAWVITGPRSLENITPYIESALTPADGSYSVHIGESQLIWDGIDSPIGLHTKDVTILNNKGAVAASFPEIRVHLFLWKLLLAQVDIRTLEIQHPTALLIQQDDGSLSFGFGNSEESAGNPMAGALALLASDDSSQRLKSLVIRHATVSVKKAHAGVFLQSDDASLVVTRTHAAAKGTLTMPLSFGDKHGEFETDFTVDGKDKTVTAETIYTDVPSSILHDLIPTQPLFESVNLTVSGWTHGVSEFDGTVHSIDFMADTGAGTVDLPKQFPAPLNPLHIHAEGKVLDHLTTCTLSKAQIDFKGFSISASGTVHKEGEHYAIDGHAETAQVPVESLPKYWPMALAPHTREWVTGHIVKGVIPQASVDLHFKAGELELKDTPEQAVAASIVVRDAEVHYLPQHPAVSQIDAVVNFTGKSMLANITKARDFSDTHVTSGTVFFPDLNADDVRMFLDVNLAAPAVDVIDFLSLPDVNKAQSLGLSKNVSGTIDGNVKLNFIAFSDDDNVPPSGKKIHKESTGNIMYAVNAATHDATLPHLMNKYDLTAANMKLSVNNKEIKAEGKTNINTVPMVVKLESVFTPPHETTYSIKADIPVDHLKDFGHTAPDFLSGVLGVDARFTESDEKEQDTIKLDLTRAALHFPEHGFEKPLKEEASAEFETEKLPSGNTAVQSFTLQGSGLAVSGKAEMMPDGTITSATLNQVQVVGDNLDYVEYTRLPKGIKLVAKGKTINLAPYVDQKDGDDTRTRILDITADKAILGPDRIFTNLSAQSDCSAICESTHVKAHLKDGTGFTYDITNGKIAAASDNAGELMRVLGVNDNIQAGKISLTGAYSGELIKGTVLMSDYTLKKAPILTKMITIASLTGIFNTVTGNGIAFSKMTAPFEYEHGKILLKEAKAHGSALGITADGLIDTRASTLNLQGTLIPSYTLNSLAGNIPLIGRLLTGGTEKGIIALNYSVSGKMEDPSVSINPLSVFTPGFMRGIFDIFDEPAPDLDKIKATQPQADKAAASVPASTTH